MFIHFLFLILSVLFLFFVVFFIIIKESHVYIKS